MKVYVASPLGFAESTRAYLQVIVESLQSAGQQVLNPWDQPEGRKILKAQGVEDRKSRLRALAGANRAVAEANERAIRSCDWMLAILDGVDVDSGTASEIGFAYGLGKRIIGLRTDFRRTGDNEGVVVNLQVQYWIEASGGRVVRSLDEVDEAIQRSHELTSSPTTQASKTT